MALPTRKKRRVMDEFIDIVNAEIERQGITMTELAREARIGRAYLYRVLAQEQIPSFQWVQKVASILKIEISFKAVGLPD